MSVRPDWFRPPSGGPSVAHVAGRILRDAPVGDLRALADDRRRVVLAVDLGATKVAGVIGDGHDATAASAPLLRLADADVELGAVEDFVADLVLGCGGDVGVVVLAAAPAVDDLGQVTRWPNRPWWRGVDLVAALELVAAAPVVALDDGAAAAVAETIVSGVDHLLYLGLGTGVGSGYVAGAEVVPTADADAGHHRVAAPGPPCACGRSGCVQALASGPSVLARAGEEAGVPVGPVDLRLGLDAGEPWARAAIEQAGGAIAALVGDTWDRFRPRACHVGGGFGAAFPEVAAAADAALADRGLPTRGRVAATGAWASLLGASFVASMWLARKGTHHG